MEIEQLCVIPQNNLVNVVKLLALNQDRDKQIRSFLERLKGCASTSKLTVKCTSVGCDEDVSYSENVILHALVKGLSDSEIQQEVLADGEDKSLDETVKYVEAKEAVKRSVGYLGEAGLSSSQLYKLTLHKAAQQDKMLGQFEKSAERCCHCNRQSHGLKPNYVDRKKTCPAFGKPCKKCEKKGHFEVCCQLAEAKVDTISARDSTNFDAKCLKTATKVTRVQMDVVRDGKGKLHKLSPDHPIPHMVEVNGKYQIA